MYELTRQERLALIVIALLIVTGAAGRHAVWRARAAPLLQYTSDAADTLAADGARALRNSVEREIGSARRRAEPLAAGERIDPNTASAEQLDRLPGVGPAIAQRIVEARQARGPFRSLAELEEVPGVGPAMLKRIAGFVALPLESPRGASIDINRADAAELDRLPGIGPAIAQRIVEHRREHGRFRNWADLENVPGIGPRLRERLQTVARLGP